MIYGIFVMDMLLEISHIRPRHKISYRLYRLEKRRPLSLEKRGVLVILMINECQCFLRVAFTSIWILLDDLLNFNKFFFC